MIYFVFLKNILLTTFYKNTYLKNFIYEMPFNMVLINFKLFHVFIHSYFFLQEFSCFNPQK